MDAVSISLLVLAAVFLIGVGSRALFARTGIPEVLPLILLGLLLGPVFGVLDRALLLRAAPHLGAVAQRRGDAGARFEAAGGQRGPASKRSNICFIWAADPRAPEWAIM